MVGVERKEVAGRLTRFAFSLAECRAHVIVSILARLGSSLPVCLSASSLSQQMPLSISESLNFASGVLQARRRIQIVSDCLPAASTLLPVLSSLLFLVLPNAHGQLTRRSYSLFGFHTPIYSSGRPFLVLPTNLSTCVSLEFIPNTMYVFRFPSCRSNNPLAPQFHIPYADSDNTIPPFYSALTVP